MISTPPLLSRITAFAILLCGSLLTTSASRAPQHLIFTYMGDPSTTLTANWQSLLDAKDGNTESLQAGTAVVYYDLESRGGITEKYTHKVTGEAFQIDGLKDRFIYRAQLTGLSPNTTYYIAVGNELTGISTEVMVHTIPQDETPIRFVTGGDMGVSEEMRLLLKNAATHNPRFAVVGGDVAYANGRLNSVNSWDAWLKFYTEEMVTPYGYSIPLVLAIGNHEVDGGFRKSKKDAPFYFNFFGQDPDLTYFTRQFGKNFVLFSLDSGHVATHESQALWLEQQLETYANVKHTAAVYHVPLYPTHRGFAEQYSEEGRTFWGPLFDKYALDVAFENHDHTFKRTHLLKDGAITKDGSGTLYLGDGCWGRTAREIDYMKRWYVDAVGSIQHFWLVDVNATEMVYKAVDIDNQVFDVYPLNTPGVDAAETVFAAKKHNFSLPSNTLKVAGFTNVAPRWNGGETTLHVKNTFDFTVTCELRANLPKNALTVEGMPTQPLVLKAHEEQSFDITFTPSKGSAVDSKKLKIGIEVKLKFDDANTKEPIVLKKTVPVPLRIKK